VYHLGQKALYKYSSSPFLSFPFLSFTSQETGWEERDASDVFCVSRVT